MESNLQILIVCDDRHGAAALVNEIGELFEGCQPAVCDPPSSLQMLRARTFDLAILHVESGDVGVEEVADSIRHVAVDLPIVVSLPADSSISARGLSKLRGVYCLARSYDNPQSVTTIIEDILRVPVDGSLGLIGPEENLTEATAEMMRTAAGTLSHEINNPLMAILGISELLLTEGKAQNPDLARKITMIRKSAERIEDSLKRLSNISEPSIKPTPSGSIVDISRDVKTSPKRKTRPELSNSVDK